MFDFSIKLDTEDPNRGWVVDRVSVHHEGEEVAYLKCSYIPQANIPKFYPHGVVSYLDKVDGWCGAEARYERGDTEYWAHINHREKMTSEEALAYMVKYHQEKYNQFKNWFVDKPFEDYISVTTPFRRRGLAEQMLLYAAEYYRGKGMEFFLSNLRTKPNKELFRKLKAKYNLPKRRFVWASPSDRYYFPLDLAA